MDISELELLIVNKGIVDQWWISIDGVMEEGVVSSVMIREHVNSPNVGEVLVLHVDNAEVTPPPWVTVQKSPSYAPSGAGSPSVLPEQREPSTGVFLLLLPLLGVLGTAFLPVLILNFLFMIVILFTGILVSADAQALRIKEKGSKNSPFMWGLFTWLLFLLGYPMYMFTRKKYGGRNYGVVSVLLTLLLVGCFYLVGSA